MARRLIGAKGCNMKRVIEICCKGASFEQQQDMVKLRLRGRGSGFKEGPKQEESNEPLHLCISSRYFDKYQIACSHVQELILTVYEEFKRFCEKSKREPRADLAIKKTETVTGRRSVPQQPPQVFQAQPGYRSAYQQYNAGLYGDRFAQSQYGFAQQQFVPRAESDQQAETWKEAKPWAPQYTQ